MATVAQLDIKYGAQTSGAEAGTKKVQGLIGGLTSGARGLATVAGGIVLGGAITALVGNVGRLATAGINFGGEMANVNSILQLSDEGIAQLSDQVIRLSSDPRVLAGPAELAAGLYEISSSGFTGAEGLQVLEAASLAATAGVTTTDVASRAITASLNAYGLGADQAGYVSDVLFKVVDRGVISFEQLANNLGNTLPIANSLGVGIEELGSAYALMTLKGVSASQAETQIAGLMRSALNPTEALTAAVGAHGYASAESAIASEGMAGFLKMVMEASGGSKEALFEMLGTQEAMNAALILGANDGEDFVEMLEDMEGASGATGRALEKQMKSSRFAIAQARKQVEILATIVMGALSPAITFLASGFSNLVTGGIMPFIQSIRDLMDGGLNPVEAALTAVQMALARIGGEDTPAVIAAIARGFGDLADLAGGLGDALGQVIDAFQALVSGDISGFFDELGEAATGAWDAITTLLGTLAGAVIDLGAIALSAAIEFAGDLPGLAADAWGWITDHLGVSSIIAAGLFFGLPGVFIAAAVHWRGDLADMVGRGFAWILEKLGFGPVQGDGTGGPEGSYALPLGEIVTSAVIGWAGDLQSMLGRGFAWILEKLGFGPVQGDGTGGPEGSYTLPLGTVVTSAIIGWAGDLTAMVGNGWAWVRDKLGFGAVQGDGTGGPEGSYTIPLGDILIDGLGKLGTALQGIADDIIGWLKKELGIDRPMRAGSEPLSVGDVFFDGIAKLGTVLQGVADDVMGWVKKELNVGGPTKVGQGDSIPLGTFLLDGIAELGGMLKGIALNVAGWVRSKIPFVTGVAIQLGNFLAEGIAELGGMLKAIALNVAGWVRSKIPFVTGAAIQLGSFLAEGAVELWGKLKAIALNVAAWVRSQIPFITGIAIQVGSFLADGAVALGARLSGFKANPGAVINTLLGAIPTVNVPVKEVLIQVAKINQDMTQAEAEEEVQKDVDAWGALKTSAAELKLTIGSLIPDGLEVALNALWAAIKGVVIVHLLPLVAAWKALREGFAGLDTILMNVTGAFTLLDMGLKLARDTAKSFGREIKSAIDTVVNVVRGFWDKAKAGPDAFIAWATDAAVKALAVYTAVKGMADNVSSTLSGWGDTIEGYLAPVTAALDKVAAAAGFVRDAINAIPGLSGGEVGAQGPGLGSQSGPDLPYPRQPYSKPPTRSNPAYGAGTLGGGSGGGPTATGEMVLSLPGTGTGSSLATWRNTFQRQIDEMVLRSKQTLATMPPQTQQVARQVPPSFIQGLSQFVPTVNQQLQTVTQGWGTGMGGIVTSTRNTGVQTVSSFGSSLAPMPTTARTIGGSASTSFGGGIFPMIGGAVSTAFSALSGFGSSLAPIGPNAGRMAGDANTRFGSALSPIAPGAGMTGLLTSTLFGASLAPIAPGAGRTGGETNSRFGSGLNPILGVSSMLGRGAQTQFTGGLSPIVGISGGLANSAAGSVRGGLASASGGAFGYGAAVGNQFAAGIRSSLGAVSAAAAALRALMPSSPAKTGPLAKPISFDYISNDLERAMGRMGGIARQGMRDTANAFNQSGRMAFSGRTSGGMGGGNTYIINVLKSEEMLALLRGAESGRIAQSQMSSRSREIGLGLRGI